MRYTITGGTGFIGSCLAKELRKRGNEVLIADIKEPPETTNYKFCDVTDPFQVQSAIKGRDIVIHLAANPDPSLAERNPRWDLKVNVEGTLNVIDSCKEHSKRMIFSSTAAVNYSPFSCYAISKRTAEKYILRNVQKGLDASILRFNNVYGPTQSKGFVISDFICKLSKNPRVISIRGTGLDLRDFVFIDDVVDATILVAEKGETGKIYEIGTGKQITMIELAKKIGIIMNNIEPQIISAQTTQSWSRKEIPQNLEEITSLGWKPQYTLEEGLEVVIKKSE